MLRREIWLGANGEVTRYNLAYINFLLHAKDNGRVLGYDNAHASHHKHFMGAVTVVNLKSFEEIENRFQADWEAILKG